MAANSTQQIAGRLMGDLMRDFGLTKAQAAGLVGNLAHESGGFKTLQEISPLVKGSRGGYGYAQWTGPRRRQFESWSKKKGLKTNSYAANYGFLKHELQTTEKSALKHIRKTQTAAQAARVTSKRFLRPGIPHMKSRLSWAGKFAGLPVNGSAPAPELPAIAGLPKSAPGLPSLGPSATGRFSLASNPSGIGRASMDVAGATMGLPRSKELAYAPSLSAAPIEAVQALSLQDLPTKQVENQSIAKAPALPGAPLGSVERSSLPDLPQKDTRLALADFDQSFRMGPVSPPKASGRVRGGAGVSASGMASAAVPSGFKAPSVSPRMAEAQSMAALDAIPNAPIDLVGDMQPAFGEVKKPGLQAIDLPKIGAKPAAPNPYGAFGVPERMMDPNAANLIPQTKLPNAPNPVGIKGAQMLSKMALTGLGATVGGLPGALVGRLAAKALEDRVGDAAGDFFTGGVIGPSGHSYAPGSSVQRGVEAMQGGNVGGFWNHNSDLDPAAGLAYSRERAALEGRPAPKSLFEKMGEDLSKATGGGSSSGGGTIICSELYRQGYMPAEIWNADEEWGRMIARRDPDIIRGYRYWAAPVVRLMQRSDRATKIIAWLTRPWAYQMAFEVEAVPKGSALGFCTNAIGIPFSWMVGKALKLRKKWRVKYGWA